MSNKQSAILEGILKHCSDDLVKPLYYIEIDGKIFRNINQRGKFLYVSPKKARRALIDADLCIHMNYSYNDIDKILTELEESGRLKYRKMIPLVM